MTHQPLSRQERLVLAAGLLGCAALSAGYTLASRQGTTSAVHKGIITHYEQKGLFAKTYSGTLETAGKRFEFKVNPELDQTTLDDILNCLETSVRNGDTVLVYETETLVPEYNSGIKHILTSAEVLKH